MGVLVRPRCPTTQSISLPTSSIDIEFHNMGKKKFSGGEAVSYAIQKVGLGLARLDKISSKIEPVFVLRYDPHYRASFLGPQRLPFVQFIVLIEAVGRNRHLLARLASDGIPDEVLQKISDRLLPGCWWDYYLELRKRGSPYAPELWDGWSLPCCVWHPLLTPDRVQRVQDKPSAQDR